jgi:putative Mg2+ transporter-C (MgtC) family protein
MDQVSVPSDFFGQGGRLLLATALGMAIGLNREISSKPAGMRTHALVALGSALATLVGMMLAGTPASGPEAPSRVIQGLLAGIGFVGGGVILHRSRGGVEGLTTAASIWVVAIAGIAVGAGLWRAATLATALSLALLLSDGLIDRLRGTTDRRAKAREAAAAAERRAHQAPAPPPRS